MKQRTAKNGSGNDNWATPEYILKDIKEEFGEFFDPCPLNHNKKLWDGLKIDWKQVNFINPPYNNKDKVAFIKKAFEESRKGKTCILLIPVTTDILVFHDLILPYGEIRYIKGRVKFKGYDSKGKYVENKSGQSGSMFVIFKPLSIRSKR
jgi:site-specific DNA-methyltransferase (adenine-specific)